MYLTGLVHRRRLFNIALRWLTDAPHTQDARAATEIFVYDGLVSIESARRFMSSLLTDVFGVELNNLSDVLTDILASILGIDLDGPELTTPVEIVQEHPENRQLGIRQAQSGVARLALGPIVALFPMVEANVGLMLALAASFIYLSLPIVLLFGFFLYTEAMATRLMLQFISVFIRTLILQGLMAIFLMLLMGASIGDGTLTVYLGLIGVGLIGGWFLIRIASSTMKETLSQSLSAVGGIWMGATTGILGAGARKPARAALGAITLQLRWLKRLRTRALRRCSSTSRRRARATRTPATH